MEPFLIKKTQNNTSGFWQDFILSSDGAGNTSCTCHRVNYFLGKWTIMLHSIYNLMQNLNGITSSFFHWT